LSGHDHRAILGSLEGCGCRVEPQSSFLFPDTVATETVNSQDRLDPGIVVRLGS
jgi:hypothetical protein